MRCKYTGCALNSSHQTCFSGLTPDKCAFGKQEKRVEIAYKKGEKYGRMTMAKRILKIMFPSFGQRICDAVWDGIEEGQSDQEILHRLAHVRKMKEKTQ